MIVKGLFIYPIKGIRGVSIQKSNVEINGLEHDRKYMIADMAGQLISQRNTPMLTQLIPERLNDTWVIKSGDDQYVLEDGRFSEVQYEVEVWGTQFMSNEVSKEASKWFSDKVGKACRLVVMPNKQTRVKEFAKPPFKTYVSFADGYPVLTLGTKSLDQLNQKLSEEIPASRFRANIVIDTEMPHEEDEWQDFKIGEQVLFRNIKPCVRCQVITIDQISGEKGQEPNRTLAGYRKFDKGICFGSNVIILEPGQIEVGDSISLL